MTPSFFPKTEGFTKRPLLFYSPHQMTPYFSFVLTKKIPSFLYLGSPKDPYFRGLVGTSLSLPYVSAPHPYPHRSVKAYLQARKKRLWRLSFFMSLSLPFSFPSFPFPFSFFFWQGVSGITGGGAECPQRLLTGKFLLRNGKKRQGKKGKRGENCRKGKTEGGKLKMKGEKLENKERTFFFFLLVTFQNH